MTSRFLRLGAGILVGALLASCGVLNEDATRFELDLPDKKFTINADGWQVAQPAADVLLTMPCDAQPMACSTLAKSLCKTSCSGTCNPITTTCDLSLEIGLAQPISLLADQPGLKALGDPATLDVSVDTVTYNIPSNTLTIDTPELTVYVAPMSVTLPGDATAIGTIAAVPAGRQTTGPQPIEFNPTGKAKLVELMRSFKTPFNVLLGASIHLTQGQLVPTGKLEALVNITGRAGL